jgi:hypothetical protein
MDIPNSTAGGAYLSIARVSYFKDIFGKYLFINRRSTTKRNPPLDFGSKWHLEI